MLLLRTTSLVGLAAAMLLSTACTIKGSGSERVKPGAAGAAGSEDATAESGGEEVVDDGSGGEESPACLKLAEKRKKNLKLLDEGEEVVSETEEEVAACEGEGTTEEEAPVEEEVTE